MIDKGLVKRHFSRGAESYDAHAAVQLTMAEELAALAAAAAPGASELLELGCGTGRLTERLLAGWPTAVLTAVDLSPAMADAAAARLAAHKERLGIVVGDAERLPETLGLPPQPTYDLVASGATFQWLTDPAQSVGTLVRYVRPGGVVAFSTFGPDTFRELRASFHEAEETLGLPHTPRTLDFPDRDAWVRWFDRAGAVLRVEERLVRLSYAAPRDFLTSIKKVGANHVRRAGSREPFAKSLFSAMSGAYVERFGTPEGIPVTYHIYYGIAVVH